LCLSARAKAQVFLQHPVRPKFFVKVQLFYVTNRQRTFEDNSFLKESLNATNLLYIYTAWVKLYSANAHSPQWKKTTKWKSAVFSFSFAIIEMKT
jgi:pyruvate-formate lyase